MNAATSIYIFTLAMITGATLLITHHLRAGGLVLAFGIVYVSFWIANNDTPRDS